jgi:hypothetical protein
MIPCTEGPFYPFTDSASQFTIHKSQLNIGMGNTKCNFPSDIEAQSSNGLIDIKLARQPMLTPVQASGSLVPMDQGPRWDDNSIDYWTIWESQ